MRRKSTTFAALVFALGTLPLGAQGTYQQTKPLDPANIDRTANACVDFYQFANGGWLRNNPLPAAYSRWGSFEELGEKNQATLTKILEGAAASTDASKPRNYRMIGTYYASCMDSAAAERAGAAPLKDVLDDIDDIDDKKDIVEEVAEMQSKGARVLFGFGSTQDAKNSTSVIGGAFQGGLGLPDRDYYFKTDPQSQEIRKNYVAHIQRMLELGGTPAEKAAADAQRVMAFETALASSARTRVELRNPELNYNYRTKAQLDSMTPNWDWSEYFEHLGRKDIPAVDVQNPKFFATVDSLVAHAPLSDWKAYLRWKAIKDAAPLLSSAFVNEDFAFQKTLSGAKEMLPRYKRCTRAADFGLRDALGQAYVEQNFPPQAKARAMEMIRNMEAVLRERINALSWMSDATKKMALTKLAAFTKKIGYPDKWRDYSSLEIRKGSFLENVYAVNEYENKRDLAMIGKPVDRAEWGMTPPTVNAYYNPSMNEIVFPAGILQPPFFSPTADDAVNYGGMGSVIGHEMSHGFDDQGSQFDAEGNLKNWWSDADLAAFKQRTGLVVSQYDAYTVLDSVHVQGKLTLGENIGDLGGLNIAYYALQKALEGKPRTTIDGFTPEQRFFLAWAQVWRQQITPQNQRQRILTDPHSPGRWRTNGPISNMPEFARAFGCKPGDPMVRGDAVRASIWKASTARPVRSFWKRSPWCPGNYASRAPPGLSGSSRLAESIMSHPPFYYRESHGIRITVRPVYLREQSEPAAKHYVFAYFVRIENVGEQPAQLISRRWLIHDSIGEDTEVEGEGVVGEQPVISPGSVHEYQSFCILKSGEGFMEGNYNFVRADSTTFRAEIPRFLLSTGTSTSLPS